MWNVPTEKQLASLPKFYATEGVKIEEKVIYMHFFFGGCDWYMAEYDPRDRMFFGYAILNEDYQNAEWGYSSFDELIEISVSGIEIDRDKWWKPTPAGKIEKIVKGGGAPALDSEAREEEVEEVEEEEVTAATDEIDNVPEEAPENQYGLALWE